MFVYDEELNASQIELVKKLLSKAYIAKARIHEQRHDLLMEKFCRRQAITVLKQNLKRYLSTVNK